MLPRLLLSMVVVMAMACGGRPSAPNPPSLIPSAPSPVPEPAPAGEPWNLTITLRDFTGPDDCSIYTDYVGESDDWSMTVERSGESIRLDISLLDDPSVRIAYDGTVVSGVLTGVARDSVHGRVCRGSRETLGAERHLSGLFSEDGHGLAVQEVITSHLSSGETLVFHSDWNAAQQ